MWKGTSAVNKRKKNINYEEIKTKLIIIKKRKYKDQAKNETQKLLLRKSNLMKVGSEFHQIKF